MERTIAVGLMGEMNHDIWKHDVIELGIRCFLIDRSIMTHYFN